jgi:hypothetical protein
MPSIYKLESIPLGVQDLTTVPMIFILGIRVWQVTSWKQLHWDLRIKNYTIDIQTEKNQALICPCLSLMKVVGAIAVKE